VLLLFRLRNREYIGDFVGRWILGDYRFVIGR
jgi:hypothetical protein